MSTIRRLSGLLVLVVGAACTSDGPPAIPRVAVEPAERDGHWRASFELGTRVGFLRFQRPAAFFRESVWEIVTPGWTLARDGDDQTLVAAAGAEADRVVVEFPVYSDFLPKEYEFFQTFTDGSVALYTGHLYVTTSAGDVPDDEAQFVRRVEIVPRADESLFVQGEVFDARTVWDDPHGDGTYVYFGRIEPLETDEMVAIVDPGAPAWLVDRMNVLLPEMFATYTERFGEALPWKPVVLFNFDDVELSGLSSGGGTLTGLVQMSAVGHGWHEATPESSEQLLYLIAHEAAHFWNGQLHSYDEMADSWMHEGSADAFATLALMGSGYIDDTRLAQRRTEALNRCASGLQDGSLVSSLERQQFRNYYACGELIAVWSVAALSEPSDFDQLFRIWRAVFRHADREDGSYDREAYFAALASLGVDAGLLDRLRVFIDAEHSDPSAALVELMRSVGIELTRLERPLPELRRQRAAAAVRHLMADACGRFSFYTEGRRLRTEAIPDCEPFEQPLRIVSIEGHEFGPAGDLAFAATAERCKRDEEVRLGLEDGTEATVPCASAPPSPPAPLAFPKF